MGLYFRLKKRSFLFLLGCVYTPLFSTSITLINNSAFTLNAQIIDRTGRHLDLIHLVAGQMYIYDVSQGAFEPNTDDTYTPFTIIFLCESGRPYDYTVKKKKKKGEHKNPHEKKPKPSQYISQFGIWTDVPRGATVTALGCPQGSKSCVMKKHPKLKTKNGSRNSINAGSGNWSNDGGQNWTNDAGTSGRSCSGGDGTCLKAQGPRQRKARGTKRFGNQGEDSFMNAEGAVWSNDGGDSYSNDAESQSNKEKPKQPETAPVSKWSNDEDETPHKPSKKTPLPFQSRS